MSLTQTEQESPPTEIVASAQDHALIVAARPSGMLSRWMRRPGLRRRWFRPKRWTVVLALLFLALMAAWAAFPGLFASGNPTAVNPLATLAKPSWHYLLGTDQYGRSIYTALVYGTRSALETGFCCTLIGGGIGSLIGIVSGTVGGWLDMLLMRLVDMLMALPALFLALIFIAALAPTLTNEIIAVSVALTAPFARVLRGQALDVRSRLFVDAVKVVGVRRRTILWRHVLPNCLSPVLVLGSITVGTAIVLAASLNFLGLGPSGGTSWGALVSSGQAYINEEWWISVSPGVAIALLVISMNVIGDWLRDLTEPASQ